MTVGERLAAHLRAATARPFSRPADDCCAMVLDWLVECGCPDPATDLRAAYADLRSALAIVRAEGGFARMWQARMARAGFVETAAQRIGDVGVVVDAGRQTVAAIFTGRGWAAKSRRGLVIGEFRMLTAWSVAYG